MDDSLDWCGTGIGCLQESRMIDVEIRHEFLQRKLCQTQLETAQVRGPVNCSPLQQTMADLPAESLPGRKPIFDF